MHRNDAGTGGTTRLPEIAPIVVEVAVSPDPLLLAHLFSLYLYLSL